MYLDLENLLTKIYSKLILPYHLVQISNISFISPLDKIKIQHIIHGWLLAVTSFIIYLVLNKGNLHI